MRPKRFCSTARFNSWSVALRRFCLTTKRRTPASSQALTMRRPSCQRVAIGFSVITCRPDWAISIACSGCRPLGVASTTMSAGRGPEHFGQAQMPFGARTLHGLVQGVAVNVANIDDFDLGGVLLHGAKVVGRDTAATDKSHADLAAGNGWVISHLLSSQSRNTVKPAVVAAWRS
jgi:hypothetical protein